MLKNLAQSAVNYLYFSEKMIELGAHKGGPNESRKFVENYQVTS